METQWLLFPPMGTQWLLFPPMPMPMEAQWLLSQEDLAFGNVRYHFRAFRVEGRDHGVASFDFRTVTYSAGQEARRHVEDFGVRFPLSDVMSSASRREEIVHRMMMASSSLGGGGGVVDSETLDFWKDQVSTYSCQIALLQFLRYNARYGMRGGGLKFVIEFHVSIVGPVVRPRSSASSGSSEMVDGVFIVTEEEEVVPRRRSGAGASSVIKNHRVMKYGDGKDFREKECAICLVEFESEGDEDLSRIACSHTFHCRCLRRWLKQSRSCPLCRYHIDDDDANAKGRN